MRIIGSNAVKWVSPLVVCSVMFWFCLIAEYIFFFKKILLESGATFSQVNIDTLWNMIGGTRYFREGKCVVWVVI